MKEFISILIPLLLLGRLVTCDDPYWKNAKTIQSTKFFIVNNIGLTASFLWMQTCALFIGLSSEGVLGRFFQKAYYDVDGISWERVFFVSILFLIGIPFAYIWNKYHR